MIRMTRLFNCVANCTIFCNNSSWTPGREISVRSLPYTQHNDNETKQWMEQNETHTTHNAEHKRRTWTKDQHYTTWNANNCRLVWPRLVRISLLCCVVFVFLLLLFCCVSALVLVLLFLISYLLSCLSLCCVSVLLCVTSDSTVWFNPPKKTTTSDWLTASNAAAKPERS